MIFALIFVVLLAANNNPSRPDFIGGKYTAESGVNRGALRVNQGKPGGGGAALHQRCEQREWQG
jgi:hypothetical protein